MKYRTPLNTAGRIQTVCDGEGAHQSFAEECDINNIVGKYTRTGILPTGSGNVQYIDCLSMPDFQQIANIRARLETIFEELHPDERAQYRNALHFAETQLEAPEEPISDKEGQPLGSAQEPLEGLSEATTRDDEPAQGAPS